MLGKFMELSAFCDGEQVQSANRSLCRANHHPDVNPTESCSNTRHGDPSSKFRQERLFVAHDPNILKGVTYVQLQDSGQYFTRHDCTSISHTPEQLIFT